MPPKRGPVSRRGNNDRRGPSQRGGSGGGGQGRKAYGRPGGGPMRRANSGPKTCPMCGAAVDNLAAHIRQRHDDAQSHPRQ